VDGRGPNEGRVEIYKQNQWSTVSDKKWNIKDGEVVCRQLGFRFGAFTVTKNALFGEGTGLVAMDEVQCNGDEAKLLQCQHTLPAADTSHENDAGTICKTCSNGRDENVYILHTCVKAVYCYRVLIL
jgi:hypothetical protein